MADFDIWYEELKRLAHERGGEALVVGKENHRDGFEWGYDPEEELVEQGFAAAASQ